MNNDTNITGYVGSSISIITGIVGLEHGLNLFLLILGVLSGILAIIKTSVSWYKEAKKDGKITKSELKDLGEKVSPTIDRVTKTLEEIEENENNQANQD